MEKFINSLPKPVLALLAIIVGIIVIMILNPPHTICDTQEAAFRDAQKGNLFTLQQDKKKLPGELGRAKEACQLGNSAGSCYEYLMALKRVADGVGKASGECAAQVFGIPEVTTAMNDGVELMVRLAWGVKPPEVGYDRFGWMKEAEISIFCRLKHIYIRARGEESWNQLRQKISTKLPGEEPQMASEPGAITVDPRPASLVLSEQDIWNRSLFSVRCDAF